LEGSEKAPAIFARKQRSGRALLCGAIIKKRFEVWNLIPRRDTGRREKGRKRKWVERKERLCLRPLTLLMLNIGNLRSSVHYWAIYHVWMLWVKLCTEV
jgi:hypothetical protein